MPYRSKAQQRYFHSQLPQLAKKWDQETEKKRGGFKSLPNKVRKAKKTTPKRKSRKR